MIRYQWNDTMHRIYTCDLCGQVIKDPADVRLLREEGALPEETPTYLHADCYKLFLLCHSGLWNSHLLSSSTAAWFI